MLCSMPLPQDAASVFDRKNTPLMRLVDATDPQALAGPSPCAGWSGLDVVQHLIDTQRDFLLKAGADLPDPAPTVAALGPATAWRTHAEGVARQLADDTLAERPYETPFGSTTVGAAFDRFYGFDLLVHRWDIGAAAGVPVELTDRELDQVEAGHVELDPVDQVVARPVLLQADGLGRVGAHRETSRAGWRRPFQ